MEQKSVEEVVRNGKTMWKAGGCFWPTEAAALGAIKQPTMKQAFCRECGARIDTRTKGHGHQDYCFDCG